MGDKEDFDFIGELPITSDCYPKIKLHSPDLELPNLEENTYKINSAKSNKSPFEQFVDNFRRGEELPESDIISIKRVWKMASEIPVSDIPRIANFIVTCWGLYSEIAKPHVILKIHFDKVVQSAFKVANSATANKSAEIAVVTAFKYAIDNKMIKLNDSRFGTEIILEPRGLKIYISQNLTVNETRPFSGNSDFVPNRTQMMILNELDGTAHTTEGIAGLIPSPRIIKKNIFNHMSVSAIQVALKVLEQNGLVKRKPGLGWYRPDRPPTDF